ncbi:hypothetical protein CEXT_643861 [Caerostris extrusa]|uniref:Uncharacterized protein n=1 Tax=Caerostris extrusa TaxID=172846 RepID=A0AAV4NKU6_CAEEX|nr:hypothetical protein CEXT_643861 [Caerostris extrusa]
MHHVSLFLEQSTLNSFLSEDISNVNSSAIAMEIEDLDKKILSVVEKLRKMWSRRFVETGRSSWIANYR